MSKFQCRGPIAQAAVVVALLWSRSADAQVAGPPGGLWNNTVIGVQYELMNQAKAERRLQHLQGKLRRDAEWGNSAAVGRDVRRMDNLKFRIVVDEWLIRKNLLQDPGCYPYPVRLDAISCAAIAQYHRPPQGP